MRALVIGAAPAPGSEALIRSLASECEFIVAADAAGEWCLSIGVTPDLALGDFDSAAPAAPDRLSAAGIEVRTFPAEKDASDLALAVEAARCAGADGVVLSACTTERLDHTLAALGVAAMSGVETEIHEPGMRAWVLDGDTRQARSLVLPEGSTVSVFALGLADGVTLKGFMYPLSDAHLDPLSSVGLSNRTVEPCVSVEVRKGILLVMALVE